MDSLSPTSAGNLGLGSLGVIGYIGDGNEISIFKLEEVYSASLTDDIFAVDGLETLTAVTEPGTWAFMLAFGCLSVLLIRSRCRRAP